MKNKLMDAIGEIDDNYIEEAHRAKKKRRFSFEKILVPSLAFLLLIVILPKTFHGMGGAKSEATDSAYMTEDAYYNSAPAEGPMEDYEYKSEESSSILRQNKKLIVTAGMNLETLELDKTVSELLAAVNQYGGYVQSSSNYSSGNYYRTYDATIRIPSDKFDEFIAGTKESGNVTFFSTEVQDITDSYYDVQAHIDSLKAEEEKVLEFYSKAQNLTELMEVEQRLTEIRYQIDSYESTKKNYDLLVSYSTLNITIRETKVYSPTETSFVHQVAEAFTEGWANFIEIVKDILIAFIYNLWLVLIVAGAIIAVVLYRRKKKNKK